MRIPFPFLLLFALPFASCGIVGTDDPEPEAAFDVVCMRLAGMPVAFENSSTHATSYSWSFGDGGTSTEKAPSHTYDSAGTYDVTLTARADEAEATVTHRVRVFGAPPAKKVLDVERHGADNTAFGWWTAPTAMVLDYFRVTVPQCEMAGIYNQTDCCGGIEECGRWLTSDVVAAALRHHAELRSVINDGPLSFEEIRQEIAQERPIIVWYLTSTTAHILVVRGYDEAGQVYVLDPVRGEDIIPYSELERFEVGGSFLDWRETIHCIARPL